MQNSVGNPYNHQEPITKIELFAGRKKEIEDIEYELEQAVADRPQYVNFGITGAEGVGKTSLSYVAERLAEEREILPVRIDLTEEIVTDNVEIFKIIIDEITDSIGGTVRDDFINWMSGLTHKVEIDLQFIRLYFSEDANNLKITESVIRSDLSEFYTRSNSPAILLILDNAQYLAENRILLQKIRNVFELLQGYILLLVGTEDTFSQITSVFSPIARSFNNFNIKNFDKVEETEECLKLPLKEPGIIEDETIFDIHAMTSGSPYEINLVGYYMFKKYQDTEADKLVLSEDVIRELVNQIGDWRRVVEEGMIDKVDQLTDIELYLLNYLVHVRECIYSNFIEGAWGMFLEKHTVENESPVANHEYKQIHRKIKQGTENLIDTGIFQKENGKLKITDNDYMLTYIKYLSASKDIQLYLNLHRHVW